MALSWYWYSCLNYTMRFLKKNSQPLLEVFAIVRKNTDNDKCPGGVWVRYQILWDVLCGIHYAILKWEGTGGRYQLGWDISCGIHNGTTQTREAPNIKNGGQPQGRVSKVLYAVFVRRWITNALLHDTISYEDQTTATDTRKRFLNALLFRQTNKNRTLFVTVASSYKYSVEV